MNRLIIIVASLFIAINAHAFKGTSFLATCNSAKVEMVPDTFPSLKTPEGLKAQKEYQEYQKIYETMNTNAGVVFKAMYKAVANKEDSVATEAKALAGLAIVDSVQDVEIAAFLRKYPGSVVSPFIVLERYVNQGRDSMVTKSLPFLNKQSMDSYYGKELAATFIAKELTAIGEGMSFSMKDKDGKVINVSDFKGKYLLVDFWASWCGPCRRENPNVVLAYNKYKDQGLEILGVSLDDKKDLWLAAIEKDQLNWKHVSELKGFNTSLLKLYGIKGVPTNFLLDKTGKIIARDIMGEALQSKLKEIFD